VWFSSLIRPQSGDHSIERPGNQQFNWSPPSKAKKQARVPTGTSKPPTAGDWSAMEKVMTTARWAGERGGFSSASCQPSVVSVLVEIRNRKLEAVLKSLIKIKDIIKIFPSVIRCLAHLFDLDEIEHNFPKIAG
jgi:hypothetical protein